MKLGKFAIATVTVGVDVEAAADWLVAAREAATAVVVAPVPLSPPPRVAPLLVPDAVETAACEVADDALVAAAVRCGEAAFPTPVERSVDGGAETVDTALVADATAAAPAEELFAATDDAARGAGTTSPERENANLEILAVASTSVDAEAGDDGAAVSDDAAPAPFPETGADASDESAIGALAAVADEVVPAKLAVAAAAATGGTDGDASELAASALVAVDGGLASVEFAGAAVALATVGAMLSVVEFAFAAAAATRGDVAAVPALPAALGEGVVAEALRSAWSVTTRRAGDALLAARTASDELAGVAAL